MNGLDLANKLMNPEQKQLLIEELRAAQSSDVQRAGRADASTKSVTPMRSNIRQDFEVSIPPDLDRHVLRDYPLKYLLPYINMQMLLGHHLGLKGKVSKLLAEGDEKALQLKAVVDDILRESEENNILRPQGDVQIFPGAVGRKYDIRL